MPSSAVRTEGPCAPGAELTSVTAPDDRPRPASATTPSIRVTSSASAGCAVAIDAAVRRFGQLTAVDRVTLEVHPGQVVALLGHNGAGKTTLIRLITGLLRPHSGSITTLGMDPVREGRSVRSRTGVLTEYPALDHFLTPAENLGVHADIHGMDRSTAGRRVGELLDQLGLQAHRDLPAHSLSAGLKQRVALARALLHDPDLLLLDEPTSNLDPLGARTVREMVRELSRERGRTVVLSTHNLAEAQELADAVAVIRHGRLLAFGSLDELAGAATRIAITVAPGAAAVARKALDTWPAAHDVRVISLDTISVLNADAAVPDLVRRLVHADIEVHGVAPQRPTLEEVYVALHHGGDRPTADAMSP